VLLGIAASDLLAGLRREGSDCSMSKKMEESDLRSE